MKKIFEKIKPLFTKSTTYVIAGLIVLVLFVRQCERAKNFDKQSTIDSLTYALQKSDSAKNALGQTVYMQQTIITESQDAIRQLSDEKFNLTKKYEKRIKEVISYYEEHTNTGLDSVEVPYLDTTAQKHFEDSVVKKCADVIDFYEKNAVIVPKEAFDSTAYYKAHFTATKTGILINSINFPDSQYVRFVVTKGGLFKRGSDGKVKLWRKRTVEAQILHTNPHIKVIGQHSIFFSPKGKQNILLKAALFGAGFYLGTKL